MSPQDGVKAAAGSVQGRLPRRQHGAMLALSMLTNATFGEIP